MNTIEFTTIVKNGIVHIPKSYKEFQKTIKAKFVVIYDIIEKSNKKNHDTDIDEKKSNSKLKMSAISLNTKGYNFDRDSANER